MEYRSPVRLVLHAAEPADPYTSQALVRARKKLLSEMSLQQNEIVLEDVLYMRNDVVTLFDSITDESIWQYHCAIYTNQALLDFLEFDVFDVEGMKDAEELMHNEGFKAFVSPYFAHSFDGIAGRCIKQQDYDGLACLLNYQVFIHPDHKDEAYHRIRLYLDELVHFIKNLSWEKYMETGKGLQFLFDSCWVSFINKLPGEFAFTRDELVGRLLNVVHRFQNKADWAYLQNCCFQLQYIDCSTSLKSQVNQAEEIISNNVIQQETQQDNRGGSSFSAGRAIFAGIWILLAIIRFIGSCSDNSHHYNYTSYNDYNPQSAYSSGSDVAAMIEKMSPADYVKNEKAFKSFLDTLSVNTSNIEKGKLPTWFVPATGKEPFKNISLPFKQDGIADVTVTNNTGYNCVFFYFDASDSELDWKEGNPVAYSVYIKNRNSFNVHLDINSGNLNFYFGKKWIKLKEPIPFAIQDLSEIISTSETKQNSTTSDKQIYLPGCFLPTGNLQQTYLRHNLNIKSSVYENSSEKILHTPDSTYQLEENQYKLNLILTAKDHQVNIAAKGNLYLTQSL